MPADARVLHTHGLEVDESLLTGESATVAKGPAAVAAGGAARGAHLHGLRRHRRDARECDGRDRRDRCADRAGRDRATRRRGRAASDAASQARLSRLARWMVALGIGVTVARCRHAWARGESARERLPRRGLGRGRSGSGGSPRPSRSRWRLAREMARRGAIVRRCRRSRPSARRPSSAPTRLRLWDRRTGLRVERHEPAPGRSPTICRAAAAASAAGRSIPSIARSRCLRRARAGGRDRDAALAAVRGVAEASDGRRQPWRLGRFRRQGGTRSGACPVYRRPGRVRAAAHRRRAMGGGVRVLAVASQRRSGRDLRGGARVEPATARPCRTQRPAATHGCLLASSGARARPRGDDADGRPRSHRGGHRRGSVLRSQRGARAVHPADNSSSSRPCNEAARSSRSPATASTMLPRCAQRTSASRWAPPGPRPRARRPPVTPRTTTSRRSWRRWRKGGASRQPAIVPRLPALRQLRRGGGLPPSRSAPAWVRR